MTNNGKDLVEALRLQGWNEAADCIEQLERERDDYAHKLMESNNTYTEMHIAIEQLQDKLAKAVEALHIIDALDLKNSVSGCIPDPLLWLVNHMGSKARAVLAELEGEE